MKANNKYLIFLVLTMILLSWCSLFGKKSGSVIVIMELADRTPLGDVEVTITKDKTVVKGNTDDKGMVKLEAPAGEYTLTSSIVLYDESKYTTEKKIIIKANEVTNVTVKDEVLGLATIEVVYTKTSEPLGNSTVIVVKGDKDYPLKTNADGKASFYAKKGTCQVKASALGVESEVQELAVTAGVMPVSQISVLAIYTQDFSDNQLPDDFKIIQDTWVVEDGRLIGDSPSSSDQTSIVFGPFMSDLVYSADVSFISAVSSSRWFSIFFRAKTTGEPPYHMFTIRQDATAQNGTELAFRKPDGSWDVRRKKPYKTAMTIGQTFNIKVAVRGDIFLYFINDELQYAAIEAPYSYEGIFGFHVNGARVAFDNIKIEPYDKTKYAEYELQVE